MPCRALPFAPLILAAKAFYYYNKGVREQNVTATWASDSVQDPDVRKLAEVAPRCLLHFHPSQ